jgi:hypothetical protein
MNTRAIDDRVLKDLGNLLILHAYELLNMTTLLGNDTWEPEEPLRRAAMRLARDVGSVNERNGT